MSSMSWEIEQQDLKLKIVTVKNTVLGESC